MQIVEVKICKQSRLKYATIRDLIIQMSGVEVCSYLSSTYANTGYLIMKISEV